MTSNQVSNLGMGAVTESFLDANAITTALLPGFLTYFAPLKSGIKQIQTIHEQQELSKKGITANKNRLRVTLTTQALDIERRVVAYATNTNNNALLGEVSFTESDLKKCPNMVLKDRCQVIYNCASSNATALEEYGVTGRGLNYLQSCIDNFNTAIPATRLGIADKKKATNQLSDLFDSMAANLDKIDTLVEMVKISHPDFYKEYKSVRKIIDTSKGSLALRVKVSDSRTGEPLANVTLTLTPEDGQQRSASQTAKVSIVKKTAAQGGLNVKSLEDGNYLVKAWKPGYNEKMISVSIVNGEMAMLEIELDKL